MWYLCEFHYFIFTQAFTREFIKPRGAILLRFVKKLLSYYAVTAVKGMYPQISSVKFHLVSWLHKELLICPFIK